MEFKYALGCVLRDIRQENSWKLTTVAKAVPMSIAHLSNAERGVKELSSSMLTELCRALRVPTHQVVIEAGYLMGGLPSEMPTHEMVAPIRELV
jgi:transcriptional regulator with XRE-family HTH domain